ncbi:hypothetical protein ABZT06_49570 [Streptomyces sp. NPDC005483]
MTRTANPSRPDSGGEVGECIDEGLAADLISPMPAAVAKHTHVP